jgi:hypothetical protein
MSWIWLVAVVFGLAVLIVVLAGVALVAAAWVAQDYY